MTKEELKAAVVELEASRADASDEIDKELAALYGDYLDAVEAEIARSKKGDSDVVSLLIAVSLIGHLPALLSQRGGHQLLQNFGSNFETLTSAASDYFAAIGIPDVSFATMQGGIQGYITFASDKLNAALQTGLVNPVKTAILQSQLAGLSRDQLVTQIESLRDQLTTTAPSQTVYGLYGQFQRAVVINKAAELGLDVFLYEGPDDAITSKQCRAMLHMAPHGAPGILYRDEITLPNIERLAAKFGYHIVGRIPGDPFVDCGHPNCRHSWNPLSEEAAKKYGFLPRGATS